MDLPQLRRLLHRAAEVRLTTHARIKAIKDGLTEIDLRRTLEQGAEIEDYPDRARALLLGWAAEQFPCHIVIEGETGELQVVTADRFADFRRGRAVRQPAAGVGTHAREVACPARND